MEIHHIRYFLAVCSTLNFTKAAETCKVSQPALSWAIQQLEMEVVGLLLRRERSLTHLTDLGNLMKPHFDHIINELGDIKRQAKRFLTLEQANLRLGIMCAIGPTRLTGLLGHFSQANPGIAVQILEGIPSQLKSELEEGEVDVARMASQGGYSGHFRTEVLYTERFVVAFPTGHRFANTKAVPTGATNGETYLTRIKCEIYDYLTELSDIHCACHHSGHASEREDWIMNMVAGGMGICSIPEFSAAVPEIQTRPIIDPEVWRDVSLVTTAGRRHSPVVASFLKSLRGFEFPDSPFVESRAVA